MNPRRTQRLVDTGFKAVGAAQNKFKSLRRMPRITERALGCEQDQANACQSPQSGFLCYCSKYEDRQSKLLPLPFCDSFFRKDEPALKPIVEKLNKHMPRFQGSFLLTA